MTQATAAPRAQAGQRVQAGGGGGEGALHPAQMQHELFEPADHPLELGFGRQLAAGRLQQDQPGLPVHLRLDALSAFFGEDKVQPGWVEVQWSKPTGAGLDKVVEQLKALKLTIRNVPTDAVPADGACIFTGEPAVERIFVARSY